MPKVAYSDADRERIRTALITAALERMAQKGIQHTTVEEIYRSVGISRTFFYTFFPTKEDLIVETFYFQQPRILAYAQSLMDDPALSWREGVCQFLMSCCYGEQNGIAVMTLEEQQMLFRRLSPESYQVFREKQASLFETLLKIFGVTADRETIGLFTNLSLAAMVLRRAVPENLPFLVPEAADAAVEFQIEAIADCLERLKNGPSAPKDKE